MPPSHQNPNPNQNPSPSPKIDDAVLRAYLAEALPATDMAYVEKALRDSAELRHQLENVRQNRGEAGVHTLGAIWRRNRLTCPTREQLGAFLLDALDPQIGDYIQFHLNIVECIYCRANAADLRARATLVASSSQTLRTRIFQSSRELLGKPDSF